MEGELTSVKVLHNSQYALVSHAPDVSNCFLFFAGFVSHVSSLVDRFYTCMISGTVDCQESISDSNRAIT